MLKNAKWIWDKDNRKPNDWVVFYKEFTVRGLKEYTLEISADTRYFIYINGEICVWDGGLFRDAYCEHSGFVDQVDISKYLRVGLNNLEIVVWHYGNGGRNNNPLEVAGLIFSCKALELYSDETTLCQRHLAFGETEEPMPSYLYGGYNIGYNANWELSKDDYYKACQFPDEDYGTLFERPIPMFTLSDVMDAAYEKDGNKYTVKLPTALQVMPYIEVNAVGGEVIDIRNDRYEVRGGPGGGGVGLYNGHRTEYICKPGKNVFLNYDYMACETLEFTIPESVEVIQLSYRLSEYDSEFMKLFTSENMMANKLIEKCARTLKFCMRDNFMDCPDRERGQWIGDVSVQAPQVFYAMDEKAVALLKKAIYNFIYLRKGDCLVGNVPGINFSELPSQSLNAISDIGMISWYYEFTGDQEVLEVCLEPMVNYLKLWDMGTDGMVLRREGDWCWFDHLQNQDKVILENTWYYSALTFAKRVATILDCKEHFEFLDTRMHSISTNFEALFWKGKYYASGEIVDDRANAMAVLVGLADPEHYEWIKNILITTFNCSTYMEGYVCEALYKMGYSEFGYQRMMNRYTGLIENDNSTLWEDFMLLGTKNHAWTGAPLTIFYKYIAGIKVNCESKMIHIKPDFSQLKQQKYSINIANGILDVNLELIDGVVHGRIENDTDFAVAFESEESNAIEGIR